MEIERVRERVQQMEGKPRSFENEIKALKTQEQASEQRPIERTPMSRKAPTVPSSTKPSESTEPTNSLRKSYAQIASSSPPKSAAEKSWTEVISGNWRRKNATPNLPKLEPQKRRVMFRREPSSFQQSGADLMLFLDKALQKALTLGKI